MGCAARVALALACACAPPAVAAPAPVSVALFPARASVTVGDTLALELRVIRTGPGFNGYDAVVGFDPRALEFLPATPLGRQEGEALRGACGNTFHRFHADGDSLVIAEVALCAGFSLHASGPLYHLRFRARTPGTSPVRLRRTQFYDAGRELAPALTTDAAVLAEPPRRNAPIR